MIHFECDYTEGAIPEIIENMAATNMEQTTGYGVDPHCEHARELIKKACGRKDIDIHFLVGGKAMAGSDCGGHGPCECP